MMLGIGTGLTSQLCMRASQTPRRLFRSADLGMWLDPSDVRSLFQDAGGTMPVATFGAPVGRVLDRSGNGVDAVQALAGLCPHYARVPFGGRRNMASNSVNAGAAVGIVGVGGALPMGWSVSGVAGVHVVSLAPRNGRPNLRLRLFGLPTSTIFINLMPSTFSAVAANGQIWTASLWLQRVEGTTTNITTIHGGLFAFSGSVSLAGALGSDLTPTIADELRRATTYVIANPTVDRVVNYLRIGVSGGAIDLTLDISGIQIEQGDFPTDLQLVASAADITEAGQPSRFALLNDQINDALVATLPAGIYIVATADHAGVTILTEQALSGAFAISGTAVWLSCHQSRAQRVGNRQLDHLASCEKALTSL